MLNLCSLLYDEKVKCFLRYEPWYMNVKHIADGLQNMGARIAIFGGYSYGGQTAVNAARECGKRNIWVPLLFLCDPVRRLALGRYFLLSKTPSLFPELACIPGIGPIVIPQNVHKVIVYKQSNDRPRGWPIRKISPDTIIETVIIDDPMVGHTLMDDLSTFHTHILEEVKECLK
jgi:hypothetical protein